MLAVLLNLNVNPIMFVFGSHKKNYKILHYIFSIEFKSR